MKFFKFARELRNRCICGGDDLSEKLKLTKNRRIMLREPYRLNRIGENTDFLLQGKAKQNAV